MAKKPKHYAGLVQFDIWGNLSEYHSSGITYLTKDNFDNGVIVIDKYDYNIRAMIKTPIYYCGAELDIKFYDASNPPPPHLYHANTYIAEMKSCLEVPNFVFNDTLEYDTHYYGRSSTHFSMKSQTTNRVYRVFLKDLEVFIRNMDKGVISGDFTCCKRGYKYGIKPV